MLSEALPNDVTGLRLCKVVRDDLHISEDVYFGNGRQGVELTLRRASLSGRVGPVGETGDYWADLFDASGDMIETIGLDRTSWDSLKNHWLRCRMVTEASVRRALAEKE